MFLSSRDTPASPGPMAQKATLPLNRLFGSSGGCQPGSSGGCQPRRWLRMGTGWWVPSCWAQVRVTPRRCPQGWVPQGRQASSPTDAVTVTGCWSAGGWGGTQDTVGSPFPHWPLQFPQVPRDGDTELDNPWDRGIWGSLLDPRCWRGIGDGGEHTGEDDAAGTRV